MDTPLTYSDAKASSEDTSGSLKDILKVAHDVTFVMKDDSTRLSYMENGSSKWIPIRILKPDWNKKASDSSNAEYDAEFLRSRKMVQYCWSENGNPFLSIHRGKCKYPTPIAYRTRTRSKLTYTNL